MRTYVIRSNHPEHGSISTEIVAATEADARADFERLYPDSEILASFVKPRVP
jgi:hypothetical protein